MVFNYKSLSDVEHTTVAELLAKREAIRGLRIKKQELKGLSDVAYNKEMNGLQEEENRITREIHSIVDVTE